MIPPECIRVLHVNDKLSMDGINPSSCAILLCEWIQHLNRDRFRATVCTLRESDPGGELLQQHGITVHYFGFGKYSFQNIKGIVSLIEKENADIVHLHGYSSANFGRIAARKKGIFNIVHEHAVLSVLPHQYAADLLLRYYTDAAVAVSGSVKDFMIKGRSIPASKISIISNGIRLDKFQKCGQATLHKKRLELGIPEGFWVIGTVTRLRKEKGNEYFIRAIPSLLQEFSNLYFIIVGDGPLRGSLEALARDLNVSTHVRFLGFRKDVAELMSMFDINVIPSLSEGFPLSLVEAMSVGNAIVATKVGGMNEIARDEETVVFVRPRSPSEISRTVASLLVNPDQATKLSMAARQASKRFSIEASAASLRQLYVRLLNPKGDFKKDQYEF
jgi:glycosyltransferase involved in cell wall biosynthesis